LVELKYLNDTKKLLNRLFWQKNGTKMKTTAFDDHKDKLAIHLSHKAAVTLIDLI
jgi:hypothetical protein